jgi:hypothetical protein
MSSRTAYIPSPHNERDWQVGTAFIEFNMNVDGLPFSPLGAFLCALMRKLARRDPTLRPIADYVDLVGIGGSGAGIERHWRFDDVYSSDVRDRLGKEARALWDTRLDRSRWDEWAVAPW